MSIEIIVSVKKDDGCPDYATEYIEITDKSQLNYLYLGGLALAMIEKCKEVNKIPCNRCGSNIYGDEDE